MTKQQMNQLVAVAVAGLTAGLSGCTAGAPAAATPASAGEKHGCKGEMGDKHSCGADMKGMDDGKQKTDAPSEPAKSPPADASAQ